MVRPPFLSPALGRTGAKYSRVHLGTVSAPGEGYVEARRPGGPPPAASVVALEASPRTAFVLYSPILGATLTGPGARGRDTVLGACPGFFPGWLYDHLWEPGLHRNPPTPRQAAIRSDAVLQISEIRIAATLRASAWSIRGCCLDRAGTPSQGSQRRPGPPPPRPVFPVRPSPGSLGPQPRG